MSNHIDKIVEKLPDGLTETGVEEVASLLDEVVEERVSEEVGLLEAKVKAFLRMKLDDLKETALRELEAENGLMRSYKIFEAIKTMVASEIESSDTESVVKAYEEETEKLQAEVELLQAKLDESFKTNNILETKTSTQKTKLSTLIEELKKHKEKTDMPFKSSESAVMITNESHGEPSLTDSSSENFFLNEDVIRLSQLPVKESY
jgi:response regulator of citrate/malate metabolism|tara:strand:+ start:5940 stop:6554 length:615 start_codon:yes stop_codon:yes gene_type:complete